MELPVAIIILLIVLIVAALAIYLIATIAELVKINRGLDRVLGSVGEIATKTAPVNGVLDAINTTLVAGRNLLEGLAIKKAGADGAGLVESCFPGEGARFLQRVGRRDPILPIGETYPRGEAILGSLLGAPAPVPAAGSAAPAAPAAPAVSPGGGRITLRGAAPPPAAAPAGGPAGGGGGGRITLRGSSAPSAASEAPAEPGRLTARGQRPWER